MFKIAGKEFNLDQMQKPADLMEYTSEEQTFYLEAVAGQPSHAGFSGTGFDKKGVQIPFSLGYHSVKSMRNLLAKSGFQSGNMLEIGFNLGYSASMWLKMLPEVNLTSVDISNKEETLAGAAALTAKYPGRFRFICCDGAAVGSQLEKDFFDLAFVDGDHSEQGIIADIKTCLSLGIKTMIFDDLLPQFGLTIPALSRFDVKSLEIDGNLALAKF